MNFIPNTELVYSSAYVVVEYTPTTFPSSTDSMVNIIGIFQSFETAKLWLTPSRVIKGPIQTIDCVLKLKNDFTQYSMYVPPTGWPTVYPQTNQFPVYNQYSVTSVNPLTPKF